MCKENCKVIKNIKKVDFTNLTKFELKSVLLGKNWPQFDLFP